MKKSFAKKLLCITLVIVLCLSLTVAAFADTTPPDKPDGSGGGMGTPPDGVGGGEMGTPPDGVGGGVGTPPDGEGGDMGTPPDGNGGGTDGVDSYTAVTEYSEDTSVSGDAFTSTGADENAILVSGGKTVLDGISVSRVSEDSTGGDNSGFYGVGAAILATAGTAYVKGADISTSAAGGAGAFAYGDGTVYIADSTISTQKDTSGGIHAAGGGKLFAWNLVVNTEGASSAAIRSDRGGGTMVVDGGSYTAKGTGSPAVYCTADISVNAAELNAAKSEGICLEGLNTLRLFDCDLTSNMPENEQNECTWSVIVYQSMSGDSEVGCGTYEMIGGSLTSDNGGLFYTTNTESNFILKNVDITGADDCEFFLRCTGNTNARGWGSSGNNGADCCFTAIEQKMDGDILWDSISTLKLYMTEGSVLTGAIIDDESCAGEGGDGYADVYISSDSSWIVTGDSSLNNLYCVGSITDAEGNPVRIVGIDGTVYVDAESEYTVTVESYAEEADLSGALAADDWSDFEQEYPAELGAEAEDSSPAEEAEETSNNRTVIIIAAAVVVAAAAAVITVYSIRKKKGGSDTAE